MSEPLLKNIALLIDADNASHHGIDPVLTVLAELGQVNIRRAYGNWAKPALHKWNTITHRFGLQPQQQFDLTKGKNATDMAMTIDAIDLLYAGKVDGFGIMSSDSDFTPLVTRLRQDGLIVYGFGSAKAPEAFKTACTRYIDVDKLIDTTKEGYEQDAKPVDEDLIDLLGDAWRAASRDDDGFAKLQEVGQIAGNRSSFDVRNHGYKRLSELVRANDRFKLERRADGQLYMKRLR
ncbi:NYN domain-containing protein [Altericroceibacterium spongiae]|uniref:NYN domain-containing protein n=1 Tax=Altericroceibacterium spongiae TaxID=2320269 RepID=A0A420ERV8_9SPHN|nr:NYN domain-containing protein [Altericroceibacterium spongiae]RKF23415.1 NYN domain-containing protein [Altericroceibacterium spongiae]